MQPDNPESNPNCQPRRNELENSTGELSFSISNNPPFYNWSSSAKLLMGRTLREKLPRLTIPEDRATEAEWQQRLRERDALNKL